MEKELLYEFEESYKKNNLGRALEICVELYALKTGKVLSDNSKSQITLIMSMVCKGQKPTFEEIKNVLYGLIELATAPLN